MQDFMKENAGVGAEGVNDSAWGAGGADECGSALNRFLDTSPLVTAAQPSASAQPGKRRSAAAVQNAAKAVSRRQGRQSVAAQMQIRAPQRCQTLSWMSERGWVVVLCWVAVSCEWGGQAVSCEGVDIPGPVL
jgi:hypothetical protein